MTVWSIGFLTLPIFYLLRTQGLKYPLLVKRLACMVISGSEPADIIDILQPATLTEGMILQVKPYVYSGLIVIL